MCQYACKKRRVTQNRFRAAGHAVVFLLKMMRAAHLAKNPKHRWPISLEESLASHPMAVEWSPLLNKGMLPKDYFKTSHQKIWLTCRECGHDRCQSINGIDAGCGCCFCAARVAPCGCEWCLPRTFAAHPMAIEWHPTKNGDKQPAHFWKASHQKVWLTCRECGHDRCQPINDINAGRGCAYCGATKICDPCGCEWCLLRTFAAHPMAIEWHPTKNGDKQPAHFWKASSQKVWLTCRECGHDRCQQVSQINAGRGCGFCASKGDPCECDWCLPRTFAAHPMSVEWHPTKNGDMLPAHFWKASNQKVWLTCRECGHDRCQQVCAINAGRGCGFCSNPPVATPCGCEWCLPRTFAAHPMSVEWHPTKNGDKLPAHFWKSSMKKVWLTCRECGHDRCQVVSSINAGIGCGICINKTEKRVFSHLKSLTKAKHNYRPDWCKSDSTGWNLPFDMCTWWPGGSLPIIDEVDGDQHFVQVRNWNAPEVTQDNDAYKIVKALQNNHHVRRHIQTDVWKDKVDWRGWITETNKLLHSMTTPVLCLPKPEEKWAPLLDSLKSHDINVVFI